MLLAAPPFSVPVGDDIRIVTSGRKQPLKTQPERKQTP